MPTITNYGYRIPNNGERGSWWTDLIANFVRLDSHTHNGTDSPAISTLGIDKLSGDVLAANWVATSGGTYRQEITLPAGMTFPQVATKFFVSGGAEDGAELMLSVEKSASNKFYVYINDNSLALKVIYA